LRLWVSISTAIVLLLGTCAWGAKHPVPLDPKADSTTCVQCHEDKTKGAHVHSAIQMGCTSCHEIRVNRDVTRVKLITTTTQALCLSCHDDKKEHAGQTIHPPAIRDCVKCHDPHESANENQLQKPTTGTTKDDNLCLSCHTQGTNVPKDGSRHPALDMGCQTCHITHKNGERGQEEFDYHLTKAPPALCLDCHDGKDPDLQKAHHGQPFATANCVQCHNPHQSSKPHLMQTFLHNPFENAMCDACHQPAKDGKVALTNSDSRALCLTCHSDVGEQMEKAKVQHPGALGECTACHNPHAGRTPGFLQPDPVQACLACHTDQADQLKKAHPHQPAAVQGCAICHNAHGNDNEHLLRTAKVNDLCLECHGPDSQPKKLETEHRVAIFNGAVTLPEGYFKQVPVLPLKYGLGHPTAGHPVSSYIDVKTKAQVPMTCLNCHQPHASSQPGLLLKDEKPDMQFCRSCHSNGLNLTDVKVGGN
jgi:predicted CXXCH cytochrome family protein